MNIYLIAGDSTLDAPDVREATPAEEAGDMDEAARRVDERSDRAREYDDVSPERP